MLVNRLAWGIAKVNDNEPDAVTVREGDVTVSVPLWAVRVLLFDMRLRDEAHKALMEWERKQKVERPT